MYKVLVACLDGWNTLAEVSYILKKGGCEVDVLCRPDAWAIAGSYHNKWIESKEQPEDFCIQLTEIVKNTNYDWVILGDDLLIKLMNDRIEDEALFKKILPINNILDRAILSSKTGLAEICQKYFIKTPRSILFEGGLPISDFIGKLDYPIIIKKDFGWGGSGIAICNDEQELETELKKIPTGEKNIVQEYIIGPEIPVEALYANGELIKYATSEILTYDKDQFSYSTRRRYHSNTAIEKYLVELGRSLGINGFANLAYLQSSANGWYYLIEVDIRPNSWLASLRFAGVDFSEGIKQIVKHKEHPAETYSLEKTGKIKPVEIALFHKDLRRALYQKDVMGLLKWVVDFRYWKYIPLYDKKLTNRIVKDVWNEIFMGKMKKTLKSATIETPGYARTKMQLKN